MVGTARKSRLSGVAIAVLLGILIAAPSAHAQAAVDQYIPSGDPPGAGSNPPAGESLPPAGSAPAATASRGKKATVVSEPASDGSSGGVELPVSDGYPVTPFVVLVGLILACGIAAKLIAAGMRRREGSA